jgi:hypothetical protein
MLSIRHNVTILNPQETGRPAVETLHFISTGEVNITIICQ